MSEVGRDLRFPGIPRGLGARSGTRLSVSRIPSGLGAGDGTRLSVSGDFAWSRCQRRDETAGFRGFREVSVSEVGRDYRFSGIPCGLGVGSGTRPPVFGDSARSRCRRWDETVGFRGFRVVSVPEVGRDCRFPGNPRGLGAGGGTRPLVSGDFEWSRCRRRDETAGFRGIREVSVPKVGRDCRFRGFRVVSVPEMGRDCWFPGIPRGLGAGRGTRLLVSGDSVWSRCQRRDETAGFRGFRVVSVPEEGRDCRFPGITRGLGAGRGTRLSVSGDFEWSRCRRRDETAGFRGIREVSVPKVGRDCRFRGFRVVSVPEMGRDCWFPGIPRGLGAGRGTRLSVSGDSARSRCRRWDETSG